MHLLSVLAAAFSLTSPAFANGAHLPKEYTCVRQGISPPLTWSRAPSTAHAFALQLSELQYAPGAKPITLWTLWNIRPSQKALPAGVRWHLVGRNARGSVGYAAPCTPFNSPNQNYLFELYALKRPLRLRRGASPSKFTRALRGNVVATATLGAMMVRCRPANSCG
jgi:Raf kinase inhibitor-like YbhB/YbcL family protein